MPSPKSSTLPIQNATKHALSPITVGLNLRNDKLCRVMWQRVSFMIFINAPSSKIPSLTIAHNWLSTADSIVALT